MKEAPFMHPEQAFEPTDGRRALAISNAIVRLHREHYGRGATTVRTIIERNYVVTFLEDIYTAVERTLLEAGEREPVLQTRLAFQRAMKDRFSAAVEDATGRKVVAFLSQVHFDPDISAEIFVLEPEAADAGRKPDRNPVVPSSSPVRFQRSASGHPASVVPDSEADRIRCIILLRATCETVLAHLDEDDIDDLALSVQIDELCDTLEGELTRFANRNEEAHGEGA